MENLRNDYAGCTAKSRKKNAGDANEIISLTSDAAAKTGLTPPTIQQEVQIAK